MKISGIVWLVLLPLLSIKAQDRAFEDLRNLCQKYRDKESIHYEALMKMYTSGSPIKLIDQLQARCEIEKDLYYAKIGPVEVMKNNRYVLTVDHDDKLVVIGSASGGEKGDFRTMLMNTGELLASMKDNGLRMQKVMKGNDTWLELSQLTDANIQLCNIQYDPITFLIKRIWMKVLDPSQNSTNPVIVDITYRYNMKAAGKDIFNEGRFVTIKGKSAALQDAYQRYSLINQL